MSVNNIFANTLAPSDVTKFTLFRGVTDYTQLTQFDLYESGYSFLILLQIPVFLDKLADLEDTAKGGYGKLIDNYRHILEYEFRGCQGIEDITGETSPITNGITELNMITKVTEQGGTQFTMNYFERSGSVITKVHELFLRGVKDPRTQIKRYNGLLTSPIRVTSQADGESSKGTQETNSSSITDKGFHQEIFHFLLIVTDNTALHVEKAYLLASCQPTLANTSIYNVTRGEIQFQEMGLQFQGIPIPGRAVNRRAIQFLNYINANTIFDEMEFGYNVLNAKQVTGTGGTYVDIVENANSKAKSKSVDKLSMNNKWDYAAEDEDTEETT